MRRLIVIPLPRLGVYAALGAMLMLLLAGSLLRPAPRPEAREALAPALLGRVVVVDPGHGGFDPGMVGATGIEKEINLQVGLILAGLVEAGGGQAILTRSDDAALGVSKHEDLVGRSEVAADSGADIFISLHCNSYVSGPSQHGAQVFFQRDNEQGQALAEMVQARLTANLGNTQRVSLPHADSYLLKNIPGPTVICEMGFLSNKEEEALLMDGDYQWQLAWALYCGMVDYLCENK